MNKQTRTTLWLGTAALLLFSPHVYAAVPDWVRQAAGQTIGTYDPETNAVALLAETDATITGPTEYVEHHRRVVKILRPDGRREGDLEVEFDQQAKVLSIHAWTIDSAGREYELKDKDFAERGAFFGFELYADIRLRTAQAPAAQPGSVIAFEYEVRRHAWFNQLDWVFQENIPVREARMVLQLPAGWEYKTTWASASPVPPAPAGEHRWQWTERDLPAIEHEPRMPHPLALSGRMELTYFGAAGAVANVGSWEGLGQWYVGLTTGRRSATPEISEKARQLTAGKSDFDGKLRALTSFIQSEVRYVAVEIGVGGYQPHPAGDIFRARHGDCKDKATLLSSMLQEVGIHSEYVFINTYRGTVNPAAPSVWFNHAILGIELPGGTNADGYESVINAKNGKRYLLFDPTDEYTPAGELRAELQDSYALLATDTGGELIHTPLLPPGANLLSYSGHFKLDSEGALAGEVVETRSGDHALAERYALVYANQQQRVQRLERRLNASLRGFILQSSDIQQLDQSQKSLVLTYRFRAPYAQIRGPLMLVRPRVLGEKTFFVDQKPRHYPVEFEGTSRETDSYEIEIPQEYKVDDIPNPVKIDMGFASYQSKTEVEGSKLRYWREYIVRELRVSPDHIADLRKFEGVIGADEAAAVVLKRAQ